MFVLSCASCLRVCLGSVCSLVCMSGGGVFSTLFICLLFMCVCIVCVCIVFMFCLMVSVVVLSGEVSMFIV